MTFALYEPGRSGPGAVEPAAYAVARALLASPIGLHEEQPAEDHACAHAPPHAHPQTDRWEVRAVGLGREPGALGRRAAFPDFVGDADLYVGLGTQPLIFSLASPYGPADPYNDENDDDENEGAGGDPPADGPAVDTDALLQALASPLQLRDDASGFRDDSPDAPQTATASPTSSLSSMRSSLGCDGAVRFVARRR